MGGMTAAALLANQGFKVLVLEAAHALGGCSSSYYRQGYWFESGATTVVGFDEHQPLKYLEDQTGMNIPKVELQPSMQVHQDENTITRFKDRSQWIQEAARVFGNKQRQKEFWELVYKVADTVWKVSLKNNFFPPVSINDVWKLFKSNNPGDLWILPYALKSVAQVMQNHYVDSADFRKFVDEQLMITAQAKAHDTPFLFGAAGLAYTNYANYYVPGGLISMIHTIRDFIQGQGGIVKTKRPVELIVSAGNGYRVLTPKSSYYAKAVISNLPIWNMADVTSNDMKEYFKQEASKYEQAWGAFTMGIVTRDTFSKDLPLHHQLHFTDSQKVANTESESVFVSISHPEDTKRAEKGSRVLNISIHTSPADWFLNEQADYEQQRKKLADKIVAHLQSVLPGFSTQHIIKQFAATPFTWQNWVYRKKGRVGGIPQSMSRFILDWTPAQTPFEGLFLCGDTVYPGQGIPGVALSGINASYRVRQYFN